MAKTKSAPVSSASSAPAGKSKKPRHPGCNRIRNTPKAFRSGDHGGLNHAICCTYDTLVKEGDKLRHSKRWQEEHAKREKIAEMMQKGVEKDAKKKPADKESK